MKFLKPFDFFSHRPLNEKVSENLLAKGSRGDEVGKLQQRLIELGFLKIQKPTNFFGEETKKAVEEFQRSSGFKDKEKSTEEERLSGKIIDGIVGPTTSNLLYKVTKKRQRFSEQDILNKKLSFDAESTGQSINKNFEIRDIIELTKNKNCSLLFDGLHVIWCVDGKPTKKKWKATSGLTVGNLGSTQKSFLAKAKDLTKIAYLAGKMKMSMDQDKAAKYNEIGPTPPGKYKIGLLEKRDGEKIQPSVIESVYKYYTGGIKGLGQGKFTDDSEFSKIAWGNFRAPLQPYPSTNTYGLTSEKRGGFYIHGGAIPGSHGCIDLSKNMDDFARFLTFWQERHKQKQIDIVVDYETYNKAPLYVKFFKFSSDLLGLKD